MQMKHTKNLNPERSLLYYIKQIDSMLPSVCLVIGSLRFDDGNVNDNATNQ